MAIPRIVVSAVRGGDGKTILTTGLIAALTQQEKKVVPFKKGPDYIDAGWLALAAGRPCSNLDTHLISPQQNLQSFIQWAQTGDIVIVEGNRGLYDGLDLAGDTSTAQLSKMLLAPVILSLDATKVTRTLAAVVGGLIGFDPATHIAGVILNRVANPRHEAVLRKNIEHFCHIPVLGAIPKLQTLLPERHMGLLPTAEHALPEEAISHLGEVVSRYVDLSQLMTLAQKAPALHIDIDEKKPSASSPSVRIGIAMDSAFQFYYPENLKALENAGAELVFTSPLTEKKVPDIDALYIGGGFPETHAPFLSKNQSYRKSIQRAAEKGLPIYAECGGLIYLGKELHANEATYPMCNVLPLSFSLYEKPQGHGYVEFEVVRENPFLPKGSIFKGHEFHYSRVRDYEGDTRPFVFRMNRGKGIFEQQDGFSVHNVVAAYAHIHALGVPEWAPALVQKAREFSRANS